MIVALGAEPIGIEHSHALLVAGLPPIHHDPFDRLLIAQATALGVPIATVDSTITAYEVATIRA